MTGTVFLADPLEWQHKGFVRSMIGLARKLPEDVQIIHAPTIYLDESRNLAAATFSGDWLVMLDADATFHWNVVDRLVSTADRIGAEVLTGVYYRRMTPYWPVLYRAGEAGFEQYRELPSESEPFRIGAAGAGSLFIRRSAINKVREKFAPDQPFSFIPRGDGSRIGEDMAFFWRCMAAGIDCWCDPTIHVRHLTTCEVLPMHAPEAADPEQPAWPQETPDTNPAANMVIYTGLDRKRMSPNGVVTPRR